MIDLVTHPGAWYSDNITLVQTALIYTLLACSVQVAMRAGVFSLASVGFWTIGAYTSAILVKDHGIQHYVAIGFAVLLCTVVGFVLALPLLRLRGLYLGLATVAFDLVVVVFALNGGDLTGGPLGLYAIPVKVTVAQVLVALGVVGLLLTRLETGRIGRIFDAIRVDEPLAAALGIRVSRWRVFAFTLSAAIAAVSGAMHSLLFNAISPEQFGFPLIILVLSIVVVGGSQSWVGALIGAVIVVWLPEWLSSLAEWRDVFYGVLLIVVIAFASDGILGIARRIVRRLVRAFRHPSIVDPLGPEPETDPQPEAGPVAGPPPKPDATVSSPAESHQ